MFRLVTLDEHGVHFYIPETKTQSKQWKQSYLPLPKKTNMHPIQERSCTPSFGTATWQYSTIFSSCVLSTINTTSLFRKLQENMKSIRRGMLSIDVHGSIAFFQQCKYKIMSQQPNSPDAVQSDFFLFLHMKSLIHGHYVSDDGDLLLNWSHGYMSRGVLQSGHQRSEEEKGEVHHLAW